jgi:hypothetical protein
LNPAAAAAAAVQTEGVRQSERIRRMWAEREGLWQASTAGPAAHSHLQGPAPVLATAAAAAAAAGGPPRTRCCCCCCGCGCFTFAAVAFARVGGCNSLVLAAAGLGLRA